MKKQYFFFFLILLFAVKVKAQSISTAVFEDDCEPPLVQNTDSLGNYYVFEGMDYSNSYEDSLFVSKYDEDSTLIYTILVDEYFGYYPMLSVLPSGDFYVVYDDDYVSLFTIKYFDASGSLEWTISEPPYYLPAYEDINDSIGDYKFVFIDDIIADSTGDLYVATRIFAGMYLDGNYVKDSLKTDNEIESMALLKFEKSGSLAWSKVLSSPVNPGYNTFKNSGLFLDSDDNIYLTAQAPIDIYFNNLYIPFQDESNISDNFFIASFDPAGSLAWATKTGIKDPTSYTEPVSYNICKVDEDNSVYVQLAYEDFDADTATSSIKVIFGEELITSEESYFKIEQPESVPNIAYRVNAGGPEIMDAGGPWEEDRQPYPSMYLDPNSSNHSTGTFYYWNNTNATGAPDYIFGPNRYDRNQGGDLAYSFPLAPGAYTLNLYFSEKPSYPGATGPGQRIFDLEVNGLKVLEDFDIYAEAGLAALKKSVIFTNSGNDLDLDFIRKTGNPQINGIEVIAHYDNGSSSRYSNQSFSSHFETDYRVMNPFTNTLTVFSSTGEDTYYLELFDSNSNLIFSEAILDESGLMEIPLRKDLEPGLYILKINGQSFKLIKK